MSLAFDSLKRRSRVSSHVNVTFGLTRSLNGCMQGPLEYVQEIWFRNPNPDLAPVMSFGVGKSLIAAKISLEGETPVEVIFKPANSTVSWQNWNFQAL